MAVQHLEQRKRQKTLLFVGLGMVLASVLVLYFGVWKKTPIPQKEIIPGMVATTTPGVLRATDEKLKKINLDFEFLNEKIIPFLKTHGDIPVKIDKKEIGRDNPFIPY